jgi:hypothetical protein
VVIDPGDHLGLAQPAGDRIGDHHPTDNVHLPQLHRRITLPTLKRFPAPPAGPMLQQPVPRQDPIYRALGGHHRLTTGLE